MSLRPTPFNISVCHVEPVVCGLQSVGISVELCVSDNGDVSMEDPCMLYGIVDAWEVVLGFLSELMFADHACCQ